jgi:hypothetical protein
VVDQAAAGEFEGSAMAAVGTADPATSRRAVKHDPHRVLLFDSLESDYLEAAAGADAKHDVRVLDHVLEEFDGWSDI